MQEVSAKGRSGSKRPHSFTHFSESIHVAITRRAGQGRYPGYDICRMRPLAMQTHNIEKIAISRVLQRTLSTQGTAR